MAVILYEPMAVTFSNFPAVRPLPILDPLTGYPCPVSNNPDDVAGFLHRTNAKRMMIHRGPFPASYVARHPDQVKPWQPPVKKSQPVFYRRLTFIRFLLGRLQPQAA